MLNVTYRKVVEAAEIDRLQGVDIVYLEEPEYTNILNCILDAHKGVMYITECKSRPKDVFYFRGIKFVKQD